MTAPIIYNRSKAALELIKFGSVYAVLAVISLKAKLLVTSTWFNGTLERNHGLLLKFVYTNNEQSRLLQYFIPQCIYDVTGIPIVKAYILQRLIFTIITFICFHFYLKKWFDQKAAFCGVLFLAAILPLSYMNDLQESAPLLSLTFLLGLWAIRDKEDIWFAIVLFVGTLNNETMLFLPAVYLFYNFKNFKSSSMTILLFKTIIIALPAYAMEAYIRYVTRFSSHLGGGYHLDDNISGIINALTTTPLDYWASVYLYIFLIFGVFWAYAFMKFKDKPLFIQCSALTIPLFLIPHFITGIICEVRQMIPLSFIIIPSAMVYLFETKRHQ